MMVVKQRRMTDAPIAYPFVDQDSGNGSTYIMERVSPTWKPRGKRRKYLFLQDLLFLPGNAAATDLQQIERPLASDTSVKSQEYSVAAGTTFENLSEKNLVFCGSPSVFAPSFPDESLVKGRREVGWNVHRSEWCQGECKTKVDNVERKEAGLSTSHQGMKREYVLISQIKALRIRSITETEPSIRVLHDRIRLYCLPLQSVREKIRGHPRPMRREKTLTEFGRD